jgi:hypothetical protein
MAWFMRVILSFMRVIFWFIRVIFGSEGLYSGSKGGYMFSIQHVDNASPRERDVVKKGEKGNLRNFCSH